MNSDDKRRQTEEFLLSLGWDADEAKETATKAVEEGEPLLETLCFHTLAEHILARIHDSSWINHRADNPDCADHELITRLLDSGASAEDLAMFARMMQREYLSNLGCILDGAGIYGTPPLPFEDFRVFAVDDSDRPHAMIEELHESLSFQDWETEIELSRKAERTRDNTE